MKKLGILIFFFFLIPFFTISSYADGVVLSLGGDEATSLPCGVPYRDAGWNAFDAEGNDLSGLVHVTGKVNAMKCGEYVLEYSLTAPAGESARARRTVRVTPNALPEKREETEKTIYLTYDDGPTQYTDELLELLDEYEAKASFFVIGGEAAKYPDSVRKAFDGGHSIGVHCNTHDYYKLYSSEDGFLDDLCAARETVFDLTGQRPSIYRFPGSSETAYQFSAKKIDGGFDTLKNDLSDLGMEFFDWDDSADSKSISPGDCAYRIMKLAEKRETLIVLLHDTKYGCIPATRRLLELGREKGFCFKGLEPSDGTTHFR